MPENCVVYAFKTNDLESFEKARKIRDQVFVEEQAVDRNDEFDKYESECTHYLLEFDGKSVGTARWRVVGDKTKLERFAIYQEYRNKGLGAVLLKKVVSDSLIAGHDLYLHAQLKAIPFYARNGFKQVGEQFTECEIEHYKMEFKNC